MNQLRIRVSQLAVSRSECRAYIHNNLQKDRLILAPLYNIRFLTMADISTPTNQRLIGRLLYNGTELWYILTSHDGHVALHLTPNPRSPCTHPSNTKIILPLSMNKGTPHTIYIPQSFSNASHTIPNEVTWEFLNQLYTPTKFPIL